MFYILMMRSDKCIIPAWLLLHELLSLSPAPHPHVRPPRSPPSFSAQRQIFSDSMTHNSELHVVYSGFAILCLLNAWFLLAGVFVTWSSFFLAHFTLYLLIWAKLWFKALRSRWAPPPSPQSCTPKHLSPHPWRTVGYPPQTVGHYPGMCAFMAGWVHELAQSLNPCQSWTYICHCYGTVTEDRY